MGGLVQRYSNFGWHGGGEVSSVGDLRMLVRNERCGDTPGDAMEAAGVDALERGAGLYARFFKRALDVVLSTALLVLVMPVLVVAAAAVRLSLGSGVIFCQQRIGRDGDMFTLWKFRTMRADRRKAQRALVGDDRRRRHKHPDDPRLTRVGRLLRKTSLDELPQLLNVLVGDMSLVGPRPELPAIVASYAPWQQTRHVVRPGITCFWQVSARGEIDLHHATALDLDYIRQVSFKTDMVLLARTLPAVLRVRGF